MEKSAFISNISLKDWTLICLSLLSFAVMEHLWLITSTTYYYYDGAREQKLSSHSMDQSMYSRFALVESQKKALWMMNDGLSVVPRLK